MERTLEYAGFWNRLGARLIDQLLISIVILPILLSTYGTEYLESGALIHGSLDFWLSWVFPAVAVIAFWVRKSATPGLMAVSARIVDARTGEKPSTGQFVGRYLATFLSALPLGLGYLWIAFDRRKQAWHDKLANTVVVHARKSEPVVFDRQDGSTVPDSDSVVMSPA